MPHARRGFAGAAACPDAPEFYTQKPARRKPSPWGEGGSPSGLTDVGPLIFQNSPINRTGSPPHPSRLTPCHPLQQERAFTQRNRPRTSEGRLFFRLAGTSPEKTRSNTHLSLTFPVGKVTIDSVWCTRGLYNSLCFIFIRHLPVGFFAPHGVSLC